MKISGFMLLLFICAIGSAHAQDGKVLFESVDSLVINADHVFIGTVKNWIPMLRQNLLLPYLQSRNV